jgi:hypothetical protein
LNPGGRLTHVKGQAVNVELSSHIEQDIELVLRLRRARSAILGDGLFSDPVWDMLLQLYLARLNGRRLKLKDLMTDVPGSTRARWACVLEERGLVTCHLDVLVPAVLWIELSESGLAKMSQLVSGLRHWQPID